VSFRGRTLAALFACAGFAATAAWAAQVLGVPGAAFVGVFLSVPVVLWCARFLAGSVERSLAGLDDGLRAFRDSDFSVRLASREGDGAAGLKHLYNDVADLLRGQRNEVYQKELLLDTILQRTPIAVMLVNAGDRIVYTNAAARELFSHGARLDGRHFSEVVDGLAEAFRGAVATRADAIVTVTTDGQDETFHLSQRTFQLNTVGHRLLLVERLTAELRRQEIAVWKNAIRVINHELNNTIAPISSMIHSARIAQERPEHRHRLGEIYATIEERLAFLRSFLESYAQFARLPSPRRERTSWRDVLDDVRALYPFRAEGTVADEALIDRAQMQQVLINLVKNAHESGSDSADIVVSIQRAVDGTLVRVLDRGQGMPEVVMRNALVPFYTTKPNGSGLGLPLCNEIVEAHGGRMRLQGREGGGTAVTCWVP
jgi:two-component system, NtrC family, nitrogen regulation sensor histidine kinase NtrY